VRGSSLGGWAVLLLISTGVASACGSSSGSHAAPVDGGTQVEGGAGPDGGATSDGGGAPGEDSGEGGLPEAGTTIVPGNGCAPGLGIDAGFYTCQTQYFVAPTGNDGNSGTSMADALQTIGAATKLALQAGDCVTVAAGTYNETVLVTSSGSADTCTGYVVFRSESPGAAKVISTDAYNGFMVNANYVMVDGFDLHDTSTGSAFTTRSPAARSSSTTTSPQCGTWRTTAGVRA
jgi:hypothetical protein